MGELDTSMSCFPACFSYDKEKREEENKQCTVG